MRGVTPSTLLDFCERQARERGEAPAFVAPGRPAWTYARLARGLDRAGHALASLGYARGARRATLLPNDLDAVGVMLAASVWTTAAPLDPRLDAAGASRLLAAMRIDALVLTPGALDGPVAAAARDAGIAIVVVRQADEGGDDSFEAATDRPRACAEPRRPEPGDAAILAHTSGTTGAPRVVAITHAALCRPTDIWRMGPSDRMLSLAPLHTTSGFGASIVATMRSGASGVILPGFDEEGFLACLDELRPTVISASPTVHAAIEDAVVRRGARMPASLRYVRSSSNGMSESAQRRLEATLGVPVIQGYGSTETGLIAQDDPTSPSRRPGTVGRAIGCEVRVADDAGRPLPPGTAGEILVRSAKVVQGYENDPEATRTAFRDGWFRTGDAGVLDDEGFLRITGRLKEMINRGGLKVAPANVDAALREHPDVQDAAAVGLAHPTLGEDLLAAVILKPGASATPDALREHALARLAPHQVPSRVVVVDAFPRTSLGKVRRTELAAEVERRLAAAPVPPRDEIERLVAAAFGDVLALTAVGAHDDFFRLGGDSLAGARVIARVAAATGVPLRPTALFEAPTVEGLARRVREAGVRAAQAEPPLVRRERRPAS